MSYMRHDPSSMGPITAATEQPLHLSLPQKQALDCIVGILLRWQRGAARLTDLTDIATKLGPVLSHVGNSLSGADPVEVEDEPS